MCSPPFKTDVLALNPIKGAICKNQPQANYGREQFFAVYCGMQVPYITNPHVFCTKVVAQARSLVGENPFKDTQHSYTALKDALRLCAAFRGTYLDFKVSSSYV